MKINSEHLKYMKRVAFASLATFGGLTSYWLGCQYEELPVKIAGASFTLWGLYEMTINTFLSVKLNFKNLEKKIKNLEEIIT